MQEVTEITREEAIAAADGYRNATQKIETINSKLKSDQAKLAAKYEDDLASLAEVQQECSEKLELYVNANRDNLLGDARSTDFAGLKIGFRKATAKLKTLGRLTWETVLERVKGNASHKVNFLKVEEKLDKTALKKADDDTLKELGVKIEQPDNFFVKL